MTIRRPTRRRGDQAGDARPWTLGDHREFESGLEADMRGIRDEMAGLRRDLTVLAGRLAYMAGALVILGVLGSAVVSAVVASTLGK